MSQKKLGMVNPSIVANESLDSSKNSAQPEKVANKPKCLSTSESPKSKDLVKKKKDIKERARSQCNDKKSSSKGIKSREKEFSALSSSVRASAKDAMRQKRIDNAFKDLFGKAIQAPDDLIKNQKTQKEASTQVKTISLVKKSNPNSSESMNPSTSGSASAANHWVIKPSVFKYPGDQSNSKPDRQVWKNDIICGREEVKLSEPEVQQKKILIKKEKLETEKNVDDCKLLSKNKKAILKSKSKAHDQSAKKENDKKGAGVKLNATTSKKVPEATNAKKDKENKTSDDKAAKEGDKMVVKIKLSKKSSENNFDEQERSFDDNVEESGFDVQETTIIDSLSPDFSPSDDEDNNSATSLAPPGSTMSPSLSSSTSSEPQLDKLFTLPDQKDSQPDDINHSDQKGKELQKKNDDDVFDDAIDDLFEVDTDDECSAPALEEFTEDYIKLLQKIQARIMAPHSGDDMMAVGRIIEKTGCCKYSEQGALNFDLAMVDKKAIMKVQRFLNIEH